MKAGETVVGSLGGGTMTGIRARAGAWGRGVVAGAVLALIAAAVAVSAHPERALARPHAHAPAAARHTVAFDRYSLTVDGRRTFVWSGEFHPFRLPSPDLWRDVLEKMKAEGFNAVSFYFDWAYHSPRSGAYDFSGVRDMDRLLDIADQVGLYVIARPGPYINAETNGGGFPGWLTTQAGRARSDAPDYLAASDQWLGAIDAVIRRHQLTNGTGSVILYQIENELASTGTAQRNYMQHLYDKVRADGITVPVFHNDKGRNGVWVPKSSSVPGTVPGPQDMYAFDGYGGGSCHSDNTPGSPAVAPDWGIWGSGGAKGGSTASPETPGFVAERGGGWFDYWGGPGSYPCMSVQEGPGYERVFYGTDIANRLSIHNVYMTFGGTSWGWLPAPVVYTSYDYGAAFDEARQIRPKATTMKEMGLFLESFEPATKLERGATITPSSPRIKVYDDVNPDTGTHLYVPMHNPSNATTDDAFTFPVSTADGTYTVPQSGTLRIDGQDAKLLVADYDLGGQHLVYSTSELMTHLVRDGGDLALLHGREGEDGETVLRYVSRPSVRVLDGDVATTWDGSTGDLRLDYTHHGVAAVRVTGGGRRPLTLLLADTDNAGTFWRQDTAGGPVLEHGPELVRGARVHGHELALTGDTKGGEPLEVWAPARLDRVTWNGERVATRPTASGGLRAERALAGPAPLHLPDLTRARWRYAPGSPEADPAFDDTEWARADRTQTSSTTPPPAGAPVLTADDYGFHQGDVWYRGHYTGDPSAATLSLRYGGGGAGMLQAWLDGTYLGQDVLPTGAASPATSGTATFTIPEAMRTARPHVLAVMVRNDGHNEDGGVNDAQKEGRGLIAATMAGAGGASVAAPIDWRVQGNLGGEDLADPVRGVMNAGGLYGERRGWHLPGYADGRWATATVPAGGVMPGTAWYRTSFSLHVPRADDASLGVTIGDPSTPRSDAHYRALIFVNGWNVGQYVADVGPQHTFVVPSGILDPRGRNTLAIAVTSDGGAGNGLEAVSLTDLGTVRGGVPVRMVRAPRWNARRWGTPGVPAQVTFDDLTSDAGDPAHGGDVVHVTGTVTNRAGATARDVRATLDAPAGWTVEPADATRLATLAPGESATLHWTVTIPGDAAGGTHQLAAAATYDQAGRSGRTGAVLGVPIRARGELYVSDLPFTAESNGWGPVERDTSVGDKAAGDGGPLVIAGSTYAKGLGTNAVSSVTLDLGGTCDAFQSDVGVDDDAGAGRGSVTFTVLADGRTVASTGVMRQGQAAQHLAADVTGAHELTLVVGDGGDGNGHDHGDWGGAELRCSG